MKLNDRQLNVLRTIFENTAKLAGKNRGQLKRRIDAYSFLDGRTVSALERRGLIEFEVGRVSGTGHALTAAGLAALGL